MKQYKRKTYNVLMLGDIADYPGKNAVIKYLPKVVAQYDPVLIIANGENAASGYGLDYESFTTLTQAGINVITLGNHAKSHTEVFDIMRKNSNVIAPANMLFNGDYHQGYYIHQIDDVFIGVINLIGNSDMNIFSDNVFNKANKLVNVLKDKCHAIFVDIHAQDASEKLMLANYLACRVTAVCGTHQHVPTADARILHGHTAYQTDLGMCGNYNWNHKNRISYIVKKFISHGEYKLFERKEDETLCGAIITFNPHSGKCISIKPIIMSELLNNNF